MTTTSCTLVDSARLRAGLTVVSKYRGRGIPASAIATGFPQKSLLENDIDVADPAGTQYRVEITKPTAGVTTVYEDSSFSFTGAPDGTYTGPETVYKNGVAYSTTYSFTIGQAGTSATVTGVTVSPSTATGSTTFAATVAGTNSPSQAVTWATTAGSITSSGVFTAPAATASVQTITITATSVLNNTKSGTATVTIAANATPIVSSVSVTPSSITVAGAATQQFSAAVAGTNSPSQAVTWTTTAGSISSAGLLTAPAATFSVQAITVTATSVLNPARSGSAVATIAALPQPGVQIVLAADSPSVMQAVSTSGSITPILVLVNKPAPRERVIVMGSGSRLIGV